jgi:alpha-ketoglutarate-dependent taurine dioxygenase/4-hydroxybenzoate polyprenyltransferase
MTVACGQEALEPFGIVQTYPAGTTWEDIDAQAIEALTLQHRVVVLRGLTPWSSKEEMVDHVRELGPLQSWQFGGIHDLKIDPSTENYLYTAHEVPLHWDGAFASECPRLLVFRCIEAGSGGGETVFFDTTRLLEQATDAEKQEWAGDVKLKTERKAYYGGTVVRKMIEPHPIDARPTLRFAEPVADLNPVEVEILGGQFYPPGARPKSSVEDLCKELRRPEFRYEHVWQEGDILIADNDALLHGRNAFENASGRRIWRANVLNRKRPWWQPLADSWRIRRPEFLNAEIPIILIPAALLAQDLRSLATWIFAEMVLLFWLLFMVGDVVNCYADRDTDRVYKTHLSEAVRRLGKHNIMMQLGVMGGLIAGLSLHLWLGQGRPYWIPLGTVLGGVMAALYSVGPAPMKESGAMQIGWYVIILFLGPMTFVSGVFVSWPEPHMMLVAASFGLLQAGTLLMNNAEDLKEDHHGRVRTASVALGRGRVLEVAVGCVVLGSVGVAGLLWPQTKVGYLAGLAFAASAGATQLWILKARRRCQNGSADEFDRVVKKANRWLPRFLMSNAWATLALALATRL